MPCADRLVKDVGAVTGDFKTVECSDKDNHRTLDSQDDIIYCDVRSSMGAQACTYQAAKLLHAIAPRIAKNLAFHRFVFTTGRFAKHM